MDPTTISDLVTPVVTSCGLEVDRVEVLLGVGEVAVSPIAATENAVRGAINAVRNRTGL